MFTGYVMHRPSTSRLLCNPSHMASMVIHCLSDVVVLSLCYSFFNVLLVNVPSVVRFCACSRRA